MLTLTARLLAHPCRTLAHLRDLLGQHAFKVALIIHVCPPRTQQVCLCLDCACAGQHEDVGLNTAIMAGAGVVGGDGGGGGVGGSGGGGGGGGGGDCEVSIMVAGCIERVRKAALNQGACVRSIVCQCISPQPLPPSHHS